MKPHLATDHAPGKPEAGEVELADDEHAYRAHMTRTVLFKVDTRVLPILALLFLCSFLDRTNVGNAKILGLAEDLNMTNLQYNQGLAVFYATYIARSVPVSSLDVPQKWPLTSFQRIALQPDPQAPNSARLVGIPHMRMGHCHHVSRLRPRLRQLRGCARRFGFDRGWSSARNGLVSLWTLYERRDGAADRHLLHGGLLVWCFWRTSCQRPFGYWASRRSGRLAMDIHHRGFAHGRLWCDCILFPGDQSCDGVVSYP